MLDSSLRTQTPNASNINFTPSRQAVSSLPIVPETTLLNTIMSSFFWLTGCLSSASAVALGAFGAHGLKTRINDPNRLANWGTAAQYQVYQTTSPPSNHIRRERG